MVSLAIFALDYVVYNILGVSLVSFIDHLDRRIAGNAALYFFILSNKHLVFVIVALIRECLYFTYKYSIIF